MGYNIGICKVKWKSPASSYKDGKQEQTRPYKIWRAMMQRQKLEYVDRNRGYEGVKVSKDFEDYDIFYGWFINQVGNSSFDDHGHYFQMDKDLLGNGLIYTKDICVFLPREINNATIKPKKKKELPTGVYKSKNRYVSKISRYNIERNLGSFKTIEEAFSAYKEAKESYVLELAEKWKDKIDIRAYNTLINYSINVED